MEKITSYFLILCCSVFFALQLTPKALSATSYPSVDWEMQNCSSWSLVAGNIHKHRQNNIPQDEVLALVAKELGTDLVQNDNPKMQKTLQEIVKLAYRHPIYDTSTKKYNNIDIGQNYAYDLCEAEKKKEDICNGVARASRNALDQKFNDQSQDDIYSYMAEQAKDPRYAPIEDPQGLFQHLAREIYYNAPKLSYGVHKAVEIEEQLFNASHFGYSLCSKRFHSSKLFED